jgi:hypothetical protein
LRELAAHHDPRPDPGRRADQRDDHRLPGDHAPDLTGGRGDRPQQRDLALTLLYRQAQRVGHDEHGDEHRQPAERRRDRDQSLPVPLELRILGRTACAARQHLRAAGDRAQAREVEAGRGNHADRVDRAGMTGQPRRFGVGQEDRRLLGDGEAGPGNADHRDRVRGRGGGEDQSRAERSRVAGDDLAGPDGRPSGGQDIRRQRGAAPAVGDNRPAAEQGGHGHVADRRPDPGHSSQPRGERGAHPRALAEQDTVADLLLPGHDRCGGGVAPDRRMDAQN